jgi:putative FmdB family regulatory protein
MPLYEYECCHCMKRAEIIKPMSKRNDIECCECGYTMRRKMSHGNFRIKGKVNFKPRKTSNPKSYVASAQDLIKNRRSR